MSKSTKTLSGRSQAIARRKTRGNSVATVAPIATKRTARGVSAPVAVVATTVKTSVRASVAPSKPVAVSEGRDMAKQRRKQMMSGQSTSAKSQPASRTRQKPTKPEAIVEPRAKSESKPRSSVKNSTTNGRAQVKSTVVEASSGRLLSKARRKSKAKGQAGVAAYKSSGGAASIVAKACNPDASGRDIARSVRTERGKRGKSGGVSSSDVSKKRQGRKNRSGGPVDKVGFSETLSGQTVSGTQVGQGQLTGAEKGDCQLVSGTEYLGTEEFVAHCSDVPAAGLTKVTMTQTTKGQTISGSRMGQAKSVTGDRTGLCSGVTGTEYLSADQGGLFCGTQSSGVNASVGGFSINPALSADTSKSSGNGSKVSGGNDFPVQSGSIQPSSVEQGAAPKKVVMSTTFAGNKTSGTQVGRLEAVTGVASGYCQSVTGTGYQGQEEIAAICQTLTVSDKTREKVAVSGTFSSKQNVTGDRTSAPLRTSGASNTNFLAGNSFVQQSNVKQQVQPVEINSGHPLTGAQPGISGLTGAQTGACELVTGTQYQGADQMSLVCQGSNVSMPGESDFPISIGEPSPVDVSQPVSVDAMASATSVITGDGWDSGSKVTGTGAPLTPARNPSIRGTAGQSPLNASNFRPHSMEEVPPSPITGSAGNTSDGAKVTLSGGARA